MKRKHKIQLSMFIYFIALFGIFSFPLLAHSENLELDMLKANFPPGDRYFSFKKRDPFIPLTGPIKKHAEKTATKPSFQKKAKLDNKATPSNMPLLPMKVYKKIQEQDPNIVIQLKTFAALFNDRAKLRKMSNKEYKNKVSEYRNLLTDMLGMQANLFVQTELQTDFDKLKFVGTLRKKGAIVALIQTHGQKGHTVKVGTFIGPNFGIVKTLDEKKIVILERYRNYLGEVLSRLRNIEFKKDQFRG